MKEKCDNNCATCPMQSQIYCCLVFSKANNSALKSIEDRVASIERMSGSDGFINPLEEIGVVPSDANELDEVNQTNV